MDPRTFLVTASLTGIAAPIGLTGRLGALPNDGGGRNSTDSGSDKTITCTTTMTDPPLPTVAHQRFSPFGEICAPSSRSSRTIT